MTKFAYLRVKNAMLFANIIANTIGIMVILYIMRWTRVMIPVDVLKLAMIISNIFLPLSMVIPLLITLVYERPIRRYMRKYFYKEQISEEDSMLAQQRLLNEPFFLIGLDLAIWLIAACLYSGTFWLYGADRMSIEEAFFQNFFTGVITVTIAFFVFEFVLQRRVIKYFFPNGGLSNVPNTHRIRIRTRLFALLLAINIVPLLAIYGDISKIYNSDIGVNPQIPELIKSIKVQIGIFICVGLWVVFLVSSNLAKPFKNIIKVLQNIKQGKFESRVQVMSNDEIGYTGDTINEMTQGLMERDKIQKSLTLAKKIQQNLVPRINIKVEGLDIAGRSIYCDETGGDYYDFLTIRSEEGSKTGVAIGDVSGHGISSALLMATVRASLRQRASLPGSAAQMITDVNAQLAKDVEYSGDFMTLFFLIVDTHNGEIEWVRAGHDPAIIYTPGTKSFKRLKGVGMALGVEADWQYSSNTWQELATGQVILLGTDGIWEAENAAGERIGKEPIYQLIQENATSSAADILKAVFEAVDRFQGEKRQEDDITAVVLKVE